MMSLGIFTIMPFRRQ